MRRNLFVLLITGLTLFLTFSKASASVFTDVASSHPNYAAINHLYDNGVIEGYDDNTFRPDQRVNRAEALKIILLGANIFVPDVQQQEIFPDVIHGVWYAKYVVKAKNLSIVKGDDSTGLFRPGDTVNLAEALKILLEADKKTTSPPSSDPYSDTPKDAWFAPYFEYAKKAVLLDQPSSANVYPATPITRGMLAELMYRLSTSSYIAADGKASYYGSAFHGKTTASGEIFDASAFTAAHRTYAFGTWLKVTNAANGKSVAVRINDRGPYGDSSRIIDLSKAAFESIASLSTGIINVKVEETRAPSPGEALPEDTDKTPESPAPSEAVPSGDMLNAAKIHCPETASLEFIPKNTFTSITLDEEIPNRVLLNEALIIKGSTSSKSDKVSAFILDSLNKQTVFSGDVQSGRFTVFIRFPREGNYQLGILPGESGKSVVKEIKALKNTCIEEVQSGNLPAVTGLNIYVEDGSTIFEWNKDDYNLFRLTLSQNGRHKSYIIKNINKWEPIIKEFQLFKAGDTELSLRGAKLTTKSILEPAQILWSPAVTKNFMATNHYEYHINKKEVDLISLTPDSIINGTIRATFKPKVPVRSEFAMIMPNGKVKKILLTSSSASPVKNSFGIEVFPSSGEILTASYKALSTGAHLLEVNNAEGLAVINVPIYVRNQFPLIPNIRDLSEQEDKDLGNDLSALRNQMLGFINADRSTYNLNALKLDTKLNNLAQYRSDDMAGNNYFGHWDKNGNDANDLRLNYGIQTMVNENIAKDVSIELAEYGLMQSAIHRSNIISDEWTRVGVGISRLSDGSYVFVQIFSEDPLDMSDINSLRNSILNKINENRLSSLALKTDLNNLAQNWSEKMANEDFFDFSDGSGNTLLDSIRNAGITASLGTYIVGNSGFASALEQIGNNSKLTESKWKNLGAGIRQDSVGIIKITLIYTE